VDTGGGSGGKGCGRSHGFQRHDPGPGKI